MASLDGRSILREGGILGEGGPRRSPVLSLPPSSVPRSLFVVLVFLPYHLFSLPSQAGTYRPGRALTWRGEKGRFFPRRPGITTKKDAIFEAKSGERSDRRETFLDSSLCMCVRGR